MAFEKLSRFFGMADEDDDEMMNYAEDETAVPEEASTPNNVVSMNQAGHAVQPRKIVVVEPRIYADAKDIATNLLNNQAVVVNFSQLESVPARRIVDFLTGTVFALKGEIQRVGDQIFLCTPPKFEIEGSISDTLKDEQGL